MGVFEEEVEKIRKFAIEYDAETKEEFHILRNAMVIDCIGFEIYRFSKITHVCAECINDLSAKTFISKEYDMVFKKHYELTFEIKKNVEKAIGKDAFFDVGFIIGGMEHIDKMVDYALEQFGQNNMFVYVLIQYYVSIYSTRYNALRYIAMLPNAIIEKIDEGSNYFKNNIAKKYFNYESCQSTLELISLLMNIFALFTAISEKIAISMVNRVREELLKMGGKVRGENPDQ